MERQIDSMINVRLGLRNAELVKNKNKNIEPYSRLSFLSKRQLIIQKMLQTRRSLPLTVVMPTEIESHLSRSFSYRPPNCRH
jgi:hypothetical protein